MSQARLYVKLRFPNVITPAILSYDNIAMLASLSFTTYYGHHRVVLRHNET